MKRFAQVICTVIVIALLVAIPSYATVQEERASNFFSSYRAYCYAASSTKIEVNFTVIGAGTMDELGASQIKVQCSSDGTNWSTVKTFSKDNYGSMTALNTAFHAATLSCTVESGYQYRAYVTFYAKNGSGQSYRYYYTEII